MILPDYAGGVIAALYNETRLSGYDRFKIEAIVQKYKIPWKIHWSDNLTEIFRHENLARVYRTGNGLLEDFFSIGAGGVHFIESKEKGSIAALLKKCGSKYDGPIADVVGGEVDSALWTGLPSKRTISIQKREELVRLLRQAEYDLESFDATNSEKALARAYIVAAKTLAEAPEPPEDIIWELIDRASKIAGVASLFVSIVTLLVTAK